MEINYKEPLIQDPRTPILNNLFAWLNFSMIQSFPMAPYLCQSRDRMPVPCIVHQTAPSDRSRWDPRWFACQKTWSLGEILTFYELSRDGFYTGGVVFSFVSRGED